jgi:transposase InsO family protein
MNEEVVAEKRNSPPRGARGAKNVRRFTTDEKLKAVRLHLDEGFTMTLVCQELGVSKASLVLWLRAYRQNGEAGLQCPYAANRAPKLPAPITDKIIELKRQNPTFGIKRISQMLRRCFFLPASPETVRQRLHDAELMDESSPPRKRNLTRPRFFERATPNQMWQTDIFTFRLGGRYAYLIAFMDDYSRFIVGADLFRSPTAPSVIEVYRVAVGEFQPPKEMLTDNGRQYTSWRGTSRFEAELKKDRVAHFKSRPHHPMTLGKIERFWSTIWQDFLVRAQFDSFEAARERIKLWIKHYNHQRPNQGIEGLCPADRFFEIQSALRKTIEAGIQDIFPLTFCAPKSMNSEIILRLQSFADRRRTRANRRSAVQGLLSFCYALFRADRSSARSAPDWSARCSPGLLSFCYTFEHRFERAGKRQQEQGSARAKSYQTHKTVDFIDCIALFPLQKGWW